MKLTRVALALSATAVAAVALVAAQEGFPPKPTEGHKLLERLAGSWEATFEGMGTKGTYTAEVDHGGFWLRGDFRADFGAEMGLFSGMDILGYDTKKKKYVSVWVDSWSDFPRPSEGDYDPETSTLSLWVEDRDEEGNPIRSRHDTKFVDADSRVFTMLKPGADGKLAPTMVISYKRKK